MNIEAANLPRNVADVSKQLVSGVSALVGDALVALYVFGAAVSPDRPAALGDIDAYGILRRPLNAGEADALRRLHAELHQTYGFECDTSWALHRAHLLAGHCVVMWGPEPMAILTEGHFPRQWHATIRAAGRVYDGSARGKDREMLVRALPSFLRYCEHRAMRALA